MVEIQIHPGDVRRVLHIRLDRPRLLAAAGILSFVVLLELFAVAVSPFVSLRRRDVVLGDQIREEHAENQKTLEQRITKLSILRERAEADRLFLLKVAEMYGLTAGLRGGGGFPMRRTGDVVAPLSPEYGDRLVHETEQGITVAAKLLEEVAAYESEHGTLIGVTPSVSPLPPDSFLLTSPFGRRISPFTKTSEFHNGLDLSVGEGTPVTAPSDGTVAFAGWFRLSTSVNWWRYGNCVVLNHDGYFQTIYAHLADVAVRSGERVRQGTVLGRVGSTGWSTSPHLHFEIRIKDQSSRAGFVPVDPRIYMLNCQWQDEAQILAARRVSPGAEEFDALPIRLGADEGRGGRTSPPRRRR